MSTKNTPIRTTKSTKSVLQQYVPKTGVRPCQQIAHFLAWVSKQLPGQFFDCQTITRAINGYSPGSRVSDPQKIVVKKAMSDAKVCLRVDYKLGYDSKRHQGARATISADDMTASTLRTAVKRSASSRQAVSNYASLIDPNKCVNPVNKKFVTAVKSSYLMSADTDTLLNRLLPPKS